MSFRVRRTREFYGSAFKHGFGKVDIKHVLTHAGGSRNEDATWVCKPPTEGMTMARKKTYGRTINGELITEEFIEKAVTRAEAGYDVDEIFRRRAEEKAASAPDARGRSGPPQRPRRRR